MHTRSLRHDTSGVPLAITYAVAGTLGTVLLAKGGRFSGWSLLALAIAAATAAWVLHVRRARRAPGGITDVLDVSDWGIRHYREFTLHAAVSWSDLDEILVVTTTTGPAGAGRHLVLNGRRGNSLVVPHDVAVETGVLVELERRLAGYDPRTFFDAVAHLGTDVFVVWRADRAAVHTPVQLKWRVPRNDRTA